MLHGPSEQEKRSSQTAEALLSWSQTWLHVAAAPESLPKELSALPGHLQTAEAGGVNSKNRKKAVFGCYSTSFYKYCHAPKHARGTLDPKDCYRYFSESPHGCFGSRTRAVRAKELKKNRGQSPCGSSPLPAGVTSVLFNVLIYYFNCALTRDLIMPREQIYKFSYFLFCC